jgi:hypothetical protein
MKRHVPVPWSLALLIVLAAPAAWAADDAHHATPAAAQRVVQQAATAAPPPTAEQATFVVRVIEAARAPTAKVDERLIEMRAELRPFEGRYNTFTLIGEQTFTLALGKSAQAALPGGASFGVQLLGFQPGKVRRVRYQVTSPGARSTRSVAPGGRTLDAIPNGEKLTIVSTTVR